MRILVAIGVAALVGCGGTEETTGARAETPAPSKVDVRGIDPIDVTAGRLFDAYQANEIDADAKYKGKVLRVTGIVDRVGRSALGEPLVVFHLAARPDGLRATFGSEDGLGGVRPQQVVEVRCRGDSALGAPRLTDCVFGRVLEE